MSGVRATLRILCQLTLVRPHPSVGRYGGTPNCIGGDTPGVGVALGWIWLANSLVERVVARRNLYYPLQLEREQCKVMGSLMGSEYHQKFIVLKTIT